MWEITSNITDTDIYYSMEKTSDGCLILSGYVSSLNNESQARIVKVNTDGEILWEKTYGDLFSEYAEIAIETIDNGYIVGCYRHEWFSQKEVRLIKTDESGNILWDRVVSKDYDCVLKDVKQTTDGDYIFVGQIGNNIWIANLDQYGNIMWELEDGGDHWDILFSIEMLEESQFIVAGFTYENTIGYSDAYILKAQYNHLVDSKNSLFEIQKTNSEIQ